MTIFTEMQTNVAKIKETYEEIIKNSVFLGLSNKEPLAPLKFLVDDSFSDIASNISANPEDECESWFLEEFAQRCGALHDEIEKIPREVSNLEVSALHTLNETLAEGILAFKATMGPPAVMRSPSPVPSMMSVHSGNGLDNEEEEESLGYRSEEEDEEESLENVSEVDENEVSTVASLSSTRKRTFGEQSDSESDDDESTITSRVRRKRGSFSTQSSEESVLLMEPYEEEVDLVNEGEPEFPGPFRIEQNSIFTRSINYFDEDEEQEEGRVMSPVDMENGDNVPSKRRVEELLEETEQLASVYESEDEDDDTYSFDGGIVANNDVDLDNEVYAQLAAELQDKIDNIRAYIGLDEANDFTCPDLDSSAAVPDRIPTNVWLTTVKSALDNKKDPVTDAQLQTYIAQATAVLTEALTHRHSLLEILLVECANQKRIFGFAPSSGASVDNILKKDEINNKLNAFSKKLTALIQSPNTIDACGHEQYAKLRSELTSLTLIVRDCATGNFKAAIEAAAARAAALATTQAINEKRATFAALMPLMVAFKVTVSLDLTEDDINFVELADDLSMGTPKEQKEKLADFSYALELAQEKIKEQLSLAAAKRERYLVNAAAIVEERVQERLDGRNTPYAMEAVQLEQLTDIHQRLIGLDINIAEQAEAIPGLLTVFAEVQKDLDAEFEIRIEPRIFAVTKEDVQTKIDEFSRLFASMVDVSKLVGLDIENDVPTFGMVGGAETINFSRALANIESALNKPDANFTRLAEQTEIMLSVLKGAKEILVGVAKKVVEARQVELLGKGVQVAELDGEETQVQRLYDLCSLALQECMSSVESGDLKEISENYHEFNEIEVLLDVALLTAQLAQLEQKFEGLHDSMESSGLDPDDDISLPVRNAYYNFPEAIADIRQALEEARPNLMVIRLEIRILTENIESLELKIKFVSLVTRTENVFRQELLGLAASVPADNEVLNELYQSLLTQLTLFSALIENTDINGLQDLSDEFQREFAAFKVALAQALNVDDPNEIEVITARLVELEQDFDNLHAPMRSVDLDPDDDMSLPDLNGSYNCSEAIDNIRQALRGFSPDLTQIRVDIGELAENLAFLKTKIVSAATNRVEHFQQELDTLKSSVPTDEGSDYYTAEEETYNSLLAQLELCSQLIEDDNLVGFSEQYNEFQEAFAEFRRELGIEEPEYEEYSKAERIEYCESHLANLAHSCLKDVDVYHSLFERAKVTIEDMKALLVQEEDGNNVDVNWGSSKNDFDTAMDWVNDYREQDKWIFDAYKNAVAEAEAEADEADYPRIQELFLEKCQELVDSDQIKSDEYFGLDLDGELLLNADGEKQLLSSVCFAVVNQEMIFAYQATLDEINVASLADWDEFYDPGYDPEAARYDSLAEVLNNIQQLNSVYGEEEHFGLFETLDRFAAAENALGNPLFPSIEENADILADKGFAVGDYERSIYVTKDDKAIVFETKMWHADAGGHAKATVTIEQDDPSVAKTHGSVDAEVVKELFDGKRSTKEDRRNAAAEIVAKANAENYFNAECAKFMATGKTEEDFRKHIATTPKKSESSDPKNAHYNKCLTAELEKLGFGVKYDPTKTATKAAERREVFEFGSNIVDAARVVTPSGSDPDALLSMGTHDHPRDRLDSDASIHNLNGYHNSNNV